jgi:hypothetical protein
LNFRAVPKSSPEADEPKKSERAGFRPEGDYDRRD